MSTNIDFSQLREVAKHWKTAEHRIKRTERFNSKLTVPAVNELRYAGYHLLEALSATDPNTAEEALKKAGRHCQRATYDAVESEVMLHLEKIRLFQEDYRNITIDLNGYDYPAIRRAAREANNLINAAKNDDETKDQHYEKLVSHCDHLANDVGTLEDMRDELNKLARAKEEADATAQEAKEKAEADAQDEKEKEIEKLTREAKRYKLTTTVAILAILVPLAGKLILDRVTANASPTEPPSIPAPSSSFVPAKLLK